MLAVRVGSHTGYWTVVFPLAVLFGLGLASLIPPLTATAMNSAPDSLAGLASGVNNAVARVAGLLWIAALPPITGLTGAAYIDLLQFRSSFAQISWICAAAFACAAVLAATFITRPPRSTPARRPALTQTAVPNSACPIAFGHAPGQTRRRDVGQVASRRSGGLDSRARAVPILPLPSCGCWEEQRSAVTVTAWGPLSSRTAEQALCRLVSVFRARIGRKAGKG
jgi:hypothetical protein